MLASLLFYFAGVADEYGLLDEEDASLLEDERGQLGRRIFIERASMAAIAVSMFAVFSLGVVAISLVTCVLAELLMPRLICWCWLSGVDKRFHRFIAELKQREIALFAVRSREARQAIPLRAQRAQYLMRLRFFSHTLANTSASLVEEGGRGHLLHNFANAELSRLAFLSSQSAEADERAMEVATLKALWQFVYLLRSEFIRVAIVSMLESNWANLPSRLFNALKCAAILFTPMPSEAPSKKRDGRELPSYGPQAAIPPLQQCRIQLEWVLERLGEGSELPPDTSALIICLQNVISTLQLSPEMEVQSESDSLRLRIALKTDEELPYDGEDGGDNEEAAASHALRTPHEYQIFEGEATIPPQLGATAESDEVPERTSPSDGRQPLMNELLGAISRRKEKCIEREMEALAKLRRVPKAEIGRHELDRRILPAGEAARDGGAQAQQQRPRGEVSRPTFGTMPDADALRKIMAVTRHGVGGDELVLGESDQPDYKTRDMGVDCGGLEET